MNELALFAGAGGVFSVDTYLAGIRSAQWNLKNTREALKKAVQADADGMLGGHLNPEWVEWLMGWPIRWTALKPLETAKFLSWLQQHSSNLTIS